VRNEVRLSFFIGAVLTQCVFSCAAGACLYSGKHRNNNVVRGFLPSVGKLRDRELEAGGHEEQGRPVVVCC